MSSFRLRDLPNYCMSMFNCWLSMLGPLFVALAVSLITFVIYTYFTLIYPTMGAEWAPKKIFHTAIAILLMFNLGFNYFQVITVSPGYPPKNHLESGQFTEIELQKLKNAPAPKKGEGWSNYCRHCDLPKPERAHHCHVCGTCVLRMDHHCPWITNCVGFGNHRFFFLFMMWLWLGCLYIASVMANALFLSTGPRHYYVLLSFFLAASVFFALGCLLGWHLYLLLTAQTTIEFLNNKLAASAARRRGETWRNPYDLGYKRNFQLFFGTGSRWWLFWIPNLNSPAGDGLTYKTIPSVSDV